MLSKNRTADKFKNINNTQIKYNSEKAVRTGCANSWNNLVQVTAFPFLYTYVYNAYKGTVRLLSSNNTDISN